MAMVVSRSSGVGLWCLVLVCYALAQVQGEEAEGDARSKLYISIDFPPEGYVFRGAQQALIAVKVSHCASDNCGRIAVLLNGLQVQLFSLSPNEFGEIRAHVNLADMPCGEHVALVRLVTHQGHKHPLDVYADVGFSIDADDADDEAEGGNVGGGECPEGSACDGGCGEHGWCQRGACVCEADWEGEDCSHAVLMNATFMPSVHPLDSPSRCAKSRAWERQSMDAPDITESLLHASLSRRCTPDRVFLFEAPPHGFGTNTHYVSTLLSKAVYEGRSLVQDGQGPYHESKYLLSLSVCTSTEARASGCHLHRRNDDLAHAEEGGMDGHYIPPMFKGRSRGVLWWRSRLVGWILRPNELLLMELQAVKNAIGYRHPIVAVQIRRGDSCAHAGSSTIRPPCKGVEAYVARAEAFAEVYGIPRVFLATDDEDVVKQFRSMTDLEVLAVPVDRSLFDSSFFIEYRLLGGYTNAAAVTRSTLLDLFLLAEADALVAGFGSHFGRVAFELSVYLKGFVPPYSSVDYPYCFHLTQKKPIGEWPAQFC